MICFHLNQVALHQNQLQVCQVALRHYHLLVLKVNVIILEHTNGYSVKSVADGITVCVGILPKTASSIQHFCF